MYDAFLESGKQSGQGFSNDLNGSKPEGLARLDCTVINGRRCSAATAHLKPILGRQNLTLITAAETNKVIIHNNKAEGVIFRYKGNEFKAFASQEVLLCGAGNFFRSSHDLRTIAIKKAWLTNMLICPLRFRMGSIFFEDTPQGTIIYRLNQNCKDATQKDLDQY